MHSSPAFACAAAAAAFLTAGCGSAPPDDVKLFSGSAGHNSPAFTTGMTVTPAGSGPSTSSAGARAGTFASPPSRTDSQASAGIAAASGAQALGIAGSAAGSAGAGQGGAGAGGQGAAGAYATTAGTAGTDDAGAAPTAPAGAGTCCSSGDCLCHGPDPSELSDAAGPYKTAQYEISTGTVIYPSDAEPPLAALALCGGFLNTGPEMAPWGPLYASHGIVLVITTTDAADVPDIRAMKLLASIEELKSENTKSGSPLYGKLSGRYGTSGYSMGGGGTTLASAQDGSLKTSVGLAPWGGDGSRVQVATLLFCGDADVVAPCDMAQGVYSGITGSTPKMLIDVAGATHFNWFDPSDAGGGTSGKYALAFQKVFLEGDERWRPLLLEQPAAATLMTNIH